jgi:hypothetical protein
MSCSCSPIIMRAPLSSLLQCQKRPIIVSKETYYSVKRDILQCQKRPITVKRDLLSVKRDLLQCQKRPITMSKETYYSVKRDILQCQKRPITVKRDLLQCQKRPTTVSKETCYSVKRGPDRPSSCSVSSDSPLSAPRQLVGSEQHISKTLARH